MRYARPPLLKFALMLTINVDGRVKPGHDGREKLFQP
jgi:hypothetical protein